MGLLSSETREQKNTVTASKHPDNLPFDKRLSETTLFFLMFSKLSRLNIWLVYPTFSYKYYGIEEQRGLKTNFTFNNADFSTFSDCI